MNNWRDVDIKYVLRSNSENYFAFVGLQQDGTLWSWGTNFNGELGLGLATGNYNVISTPSQIDTHNDWKALIANNLQHGTTLALKENGELWGWGKNPNGELGQNNNSIYASPIHIAPDQTWKKVWYERGTVFAINNNDELWSWGNNTNSRLGHYYSRLTPNKINNDVDWHKVVATRSTIFASKQDGSLWA